MFKAARKIDQWNAPQPGAFVMFGRRLACGNSPEIPGKYVDYIGQKAGNPCPPFLP